MLITQDDIIELRQRVKERGLGYILSKFAKSKKRTESTFSNSAEASNWWIIPEVNERWNIKASGNSNSTYEEYFVNKYLSDKNNLTLLSPGCGFGKHEINFAKTSQFKKILGFDISKKRVDAANFESAKLGLDNINFAVADISEINDTKYDVILFNSSLHHFYNLEELISKWIPERLKDDGFLVINDYVGPNRLQWTETQLYEINKALNLIPEQLRTYPNSNKVKRKVTGPGILRMKITDPSEAAESEKIIPLIHKNFKVVEEKEIGGNILMPLLKGISHNFVNNKAAKDILNILFKFEDKYLEDHPSDIIFGIYKKSR